MDLSGLGPYAQLYRNSKYTNYWVGSKLRDCANRANVTVRRRTALTVIIDKEPQLLVKIWGFK